MANLGSQSITPIDIATNTPGTSIPLDNAPLDLAITPDGKTAYVTNPTSDLVTPIDLATGAPEPTIDVGPEPFGIAIVPDQAPTASFAATPGATDTATSFDTSASLAPIGTIASYEWNFGDGTMTTTSSPTTSHTYTSGGTYTVTLRVTDSAGTSTTQVFTGQTMSRNGGPVGADVASGQHRKAEYDQRQPSLRCGLQYAMGRDGDQWRFGLRHRHGQRGKRVHTHGDDQLQLLPQRHVHRQPRHGRERHPCRRVGSP